MSEHHTQGRQGQSSRPRNNKSHYNRHSRRPRTPKETPQPKLTLVQRVLRFFGLGSKKDELFKNNKERKTRQGKKYEKNLQPKTKNKRQGLDKTGVRERIPSNPPTKNARLHVGNLSYEATESELEELFKGFGPVRSVNVIYNRRTYKSKGYAFVEMRYLADACKAAEVLHGQPFMGRELMVSAADERQHENDARVESTELATDGDGVQKERVFVPSSQTIEAAAPESAQEPACACASVAEESSSQPACACEADAEKPAPAACDCSSNSSASN